MFQQLVKEVIMRKVVKSIGVIILVIAVVVAVLVIKGVIEAKKHSVNEEYYTDFSALAPLEKKYSQPGGFEVSS